MELAKNFSPTDVCAGLGLNHCTFSKLADGPWSGTITVGHRVFEVRELASKWIVTDERGREHSGTQLGTAIRAAGAGVI